ncbi:MAG: hypothetical protein P4L55_12840 [Syntrophobacteraceae bacterium]|nr:hypothetical protein [Syntrophobacteraceae bacterium]
MTESTDATGARFHTPPPAGYCVIRDHGGGFRLGRLIPNKQIQTMLEGAVAKI